MSLDTDEKREQEKRSLRLIGDSFKKIVIVNKVMKPYMDDDLVSVEESIGITPRTAWWRASSLARGATTSSKDMRKCG